MKIITGMSPALGLVLPIKNPAKSSEFWQNFQTSENSTELYSYQKL
jgi:hypothetical protein